MVEVASLPSQQFQPRLYGLGAWTEHIYFGYDFVAELKPKLLVELGTDRGESYFAFCQSVQENDTATRCFAVDHWRGDAHSGSYDETTYEAVVSHNRRHYENFSTLLRSSFDEALEQFAAETIDLLHIDGHHTEAAVRHDLESWLPKLRPDGILLLHDVTMHGGDFGVWKVWAELVQQGRSFTFEQPPGLGVWQKRPSRSDGLLVETLFSPSNEQKIALLDYYRQRSSELQQKMARQWVDGSIRFAPMAAETVIKVAWTETGDYLSENAVYARIGHAKWNDLTIEIPSDEPLSTLRINFVSPLTIIEIALIAVESKSGTLWFQATTKSEFESITTGGDCIRVAAPPLTIKVTGFEPQLCLPALATGGVVGPAVLRMRLRVTPTFPDG